MTPAEDPIGGSFVLVKLGGSLITRKDQADTPRPEVIDRLAREIAAARPELSGGLILGHGSGSFGHAAAHESGLGGAAGPVSLVAERSGEPVDAAIGLAATLPDAPRGKAARVGRAASYVQGRAAALHSLVLEALREAGLPVFSVAPSNAAVAYQARIASLNAEPFALALSRSLVPVTYGDVVMDRELGASILSTETVFAGLVAELSGYGWVADRAIWLGETDGIYDAEGATVSRVSVSAGQRLREAVGGSAATDVTGGMAHRLDAALALAARGVRSWIGDGRREGALTGALKGEEVGGTVVPAAA